VFARNAQAFLTVRNPQMRRVFVTREDVLEGIHARIDEHQSRVIPIDERCGGHDFMAFGLEEIQKLLACAARFHMRCGTEREKMKKYKY